MGYGPVHQGKQLPITRWENSWAHSQSLMCCLCGKKGHLSKDCKWPRPAPKKS